MRCPLDSILGSHRDIYNCSTTLIEVEDEGKKSRINGKQWRESGKDILEKFKVAEKCIKTGKTRENKIILFSLCECVCVCRTSFCATEWGKGGTLSKLRPRSKTL